MLKKIKENPYYQKFKEMRADPKLRPITSLIIWFIFIVIVIIFVRGISSPTSSNTNTVNNTITKSISNYEFTYTNNSGVIFGESYNDKSVFIVGGNRYYYNGENVYLIKNQTAIQVSNFDLNILKITPTMINNLTAKLNYTVNGDSKQYLVPLSNFINLYEYDTDVDLSVANQYNIVIQVFEKDNNVYMYKIDLTNYYNLKGLQNNGILTIDIYSSGVNDFTQYYDDLVGGKK